MFQAESLYMNSYMADVFNQMVHLQDPTMSKKVLVGELSLQQVAYSFKSPEVVNLVA